jgi:hypothetical protein
VGRQGMIQLPAMGAIPNERAGARRHRWTPSDSAPGRPPTPDCPTPPATPPDGFRSPPAASPSISGFVSSAPVLAPSGHGDDRSTRCRFRRGFPIEHSMSFDTMPSGGS